MATTIHDGKKKMIMGRPKVYLLQNFFDTSRKDINTHRSSKPVIKKIGALENLFRAATDLLDQTEREIQDEGSIKGAVAEMCLYYEELRDIMQNRAST